MRSREEELITFSKVIEELNKNQITSIRFSKILPDPNSGKTILSSDEFQKLIQTLGLNKSLKKIEFDNILYLGWTKENIELIGNVLKNHPHLSQISLFFSKNIKADRLKEFMALLAKNVQITSLKIHSNNLFQHEFLNQLSAFLNQVSNLKKLKIIENDRYFFIFSLHPAEINQLRLFSQSLENKSLTNLCISSCKIGDVGIEILSNSLKTITTLQKLDFTNCQITKDGSRLISEILNNNIDLRELNLDNNSIQEGIIYLAEILCHQGKLKKLSVKLPQLNTDKFITDLGSIIKTNPIVELTISVCDGLTLTQDSLDKLKKILSPDNNCQLKKFNFYYHTNYKLYKNMAYDQAIPDIIRSNSSLIYFNSFQGANAEINSAILRKQYNLWRWFVNVIVTLSQWSSNQTSRIPEELFIVILLFLWKDEFMGKEKIIRDYIKLVFNNFKERFNLLKQSEKNNKSLNKDDVKKWWKREKVNEEISKLVPPSFFTMKKPTPLIIGSPVNRKNQFTS